jgi:hypothetical protein
METTRKSKAQEKHEAWVRRVRQSQISKCAAGHTYANVNGGRAITRCPFCR